MNITIPTMTAGLPDSVITIQLHDSMGMRLVLRALVAHVTDEADYFDENPTARDAALLADMYRQVALAVGKACAGGGQ